ncbi:TIGR01906 family membrane protein [Lutispora saccharofermentans]|uniref:TIGR01906 family membrane protein n=1 Tax=Lutispora saccharofermentans TaxID=3024236 RepID=A0ABT1NHY1_9FIRM|nr:TIGR01906 family membrane protein [Lutispora saccharofermentans]MCQ1530786.1 TIGR01906 family membrane protein [Lutispora saccharofermentans]
MLNKALRNISYIILALVLPLFILLISTEIAAFDINYYRTEYEKYNISRNLAIEQKDLMDSTSKLLDYLRDNRKDLDFQTTVNGIEQEFFSDRDKLHMVDVKNLFITGRNIRNGILILLLFIIIVLRYNRNIRFDVGKALLLSSIAGVLPIVLLVILINIDFYKYFTIFHEILFTNDLWLLDPNADRLVNIFPESFFSDIAFRIITYYLTAQFILFILSIMLKYTKKTY